jgi:hypothetical protein
MRTTAAVAACLMAAASLAAGQARPSVIVPVVGHWVTAVEDGEPVAIADAREWDGESGPDLAALARTLFTAPHDAFARNMDAATAFPFAVVAGVDDFSGGTIRGRFKLIGGASDQIAGFAFGLQPSGDYVYVRYNTKDGNLAVWEFVDGKRRVLTHGKYHAQIPLGAWHELVITVDGRRVRGDMAGGFSVEHELPHAVSGRLGLWAKRDAVTAFRMPLISPSVPHARR